MMRRWTRRLSSKRALAALEHVAKKKLEASSCIWKKVPCNFEMFASPCIPKDPLCRLFLSVRPSDGEETDFHECCCMLTLKSGSALNQVQPYYCRKSWSWSKVFKTIGKIVAKHNAALSWNDVDIIDAGDSIEKILVEMDLERDIQCGWHEKTFQLQKQFKECSIYGIVDLVGAVSELCQIFFSVISSIMITRSADSIERTSSPMRLPALASLFAYEETYRQRHRQLQSLDEMLSRVHIH